VAVGLDVATRVMRVHVQHVWGIAAVNHASL